MGGRLRYTAVMRGSAQRPKIGRPLQVTGPRDDDKKPRGWQLKRWQVEAIPWFDFAHHRPLRFAPVGMTGVRWVGTAGVRALAGARFLTSFGMTSRAVSSIQSGARLGARYASGSPGELGKRGTMGVLRMTDAVVVLARRRSGLGSYSGPRSSE